MIKVGYLIASQALSALTVITSVGYTTLLKAESIKSVNPTIRFVPPVLTDRGIPSGRRRGGASRGGCPWVDQPLTALVPASEKTLFKGKRGNPELNTYEAVWGLTVAERPILLFYVPYSLTVKLPIKFVLQDDLGNYVYQSSFASAGTPPGIIRFRMPSAIAPLEIGKMYHWYFLVNCGPRNEISVDGWIQRVSVSAVNPAISKVQKETPQQRFAFYATNGIWYDALETLSELRSANPENATLLASWVNFLQSVGLEAIAYQPISTAPLQPISH